MCFEVFVPRSKRDLDLILCRLVDALQPKAKMRELSHCSYIKRIKQRIVNCCFQLNCFWPLGSHTTAFRIKRYPVETMTSPYSYYIKLALLLLAMKYLGIPDIHSYLKLWKTWIQCVKGAVLVMITIFIKGDVVGVLDFR